ncbi:DUF4861 family protein [Wenyingzhuangia sp. IMCC45467]
MKRIKKTLGLVVLAIVTVACKEKKTSETKVETKTPAKTYAEISIKEGGHWQGREYLEGHFKNVSSLKVPKEHTDHSWFIRYEGPGWESNKVGYRLYLDWRNAIDIFGKVTDSLVLSQVGQDGFASYHEKQSWGTDILKVGKGLGIGSIGREIDNKMLHFEEVDSTFVSVKNTDKSSSVLVNYYGWKTAGDVVDLTSELEIFPNERYTKHTIQTSKEFEGVCTGIINHGVEYFQKDSENQKWAYIATYGEQTLVPDDLGMAIFYQKETIAEVKKGEFDHLLMFKPTQEPVSFYFLGAWEQEKDGIKTKEEFLQYLDAKLEVLNNNNVLN